MSEHKSTFGESRVDDSSDMTREQRAIIIPPDNTGQHQAISVAVERKPLRLWSIALLAVAALVGFFVVAQFTGRDSFANQLSTESEGDLTRILASLSSESTSLQEELAQLRLELADAQNSNEAGGERAEEIAEQLNQLQVLAGTVPVTGPGLVMTIEDPQSQVNYDSLVDAVQELRDAGAEAISINGRRIGVASAFTQAGTRVELDGVGLPRPFVLSAIGPAATMEGGLQIPGGTLDTLRSIVGTNVEVVRNNALNLPALETTPTFNDAAPVISGR